MLNKLIHKLILSAGLMAIILNLADRSDAVSFSLTDGNSIAEFNNTDDFLNPGTGFFNWTVNGTTQVVGTSTYFRTNDANICPSFSLVEQADCLNSGNLFSQMAIDADMDGNDEGYTFTYRVGDPITNDPRETFDVIFTYTLNGGQTGDFRSALTQNVTIDTTNNPSANRTYDVIQYYNLRLDDTLGDILDIDPVTSVALQNDNPIMGSGSKFATTTTSTAEGNQNFNNYQADNPSALLDQIDGNNNLNNSIGTITDDPAYAYQFTTTINGAGTASYEQTIALDEIEIPEPSSLLGLGGFVIGVFSLSRKNNNQDDSDD